MEGFQHKFETEGEARAYAMRHYGATDVRIIASQGAFYLEDADSGGFLRNFEREVYSGLGRKATAAR